MSVSGARRLPKCDTFVDRRVCFCRLWFTFNVAVVVIIPTAVNIFRACFSFRCAVELMGRTDLGGSLCNWSHGGSQGMGWCATISCNCGGSPGGQCAVLDASLPCWPLGESGGHRLGSPLFKTKKIKCQFYCRAEDGDKTNCADRVRRSLRKLDASVLDLDVISQGGVAAVSLCSSSSKCVLVGGQSVFRFARVVFLVSSVQGGAGVLEQRWAQGEALAHSRSDISERARHNPITP